MMNAPVPLLIRPAPALGAPRIAVVIPVHGHCVLLSEAIESVLSQRAGFGIRILLVNDGCPQVETDRTCRDHARAAPERITYLRKPHGGLSDARNHGIRYALAAWPSVEAVYMLDADNRLRPDALAHAMAALDTHPDAAWIHPNIDMFGMSWAGDYGGEYSRLIHTVMNTCEAGSLIRRCVFEAGIFFDTAFRAGFEDWDFFLSAAGAGFRGRNIESFGFLYRKRAESMLARSDREGEAIRRELRRKHAALFSPRGLAAAEQAEAPRYAILLTDRDEVLLSVDPDASDARRIRHADYEAMWWRTQTGSSRHHAPPITVVTTGPVLAALRGAGLLHSTLWWLERRLEDAPFAALEMEPQTADRLDWSEGNIDGQRPSRAALVMLRPGVMTEAMRAPSINWIGGIAAEPCALPLHTVCLRLPYELCPPGGAFDSTVHDLVALAARYRASPYRAAMEHEWEWRQPGIPWRARTHAIAQISTGLGTPYPRLAREGRDIGFILSLNDTAGIERAARNAARALRQAGQRTHLFVIDGQSCPYGAEWRAAFDSVTFLADPAFAPWDDGSSRFFGTDITEWSRHGDQRQATAMLAWLDLVVNVHGGAIAGVMGRLKAIGVRTALSLHHSDRSPFQRMIGNTYLGLAFEDAYDLILPCSQRLADWCHGMGVPEAKIVPVPNAPGFALPPGAEARIAARRAARAPTAPLRVLFLGPLERRKGIDRLIPVLEASRACLPVEWRIAGQPAAMAEGVDLPPALRTLLEPPLGTPEALAGALEWADVLFLPSHHEGLSLTVLEAMRSGVVPLVTDAGAVTEVVREGQNGIVLSQSHTLPEAMSALAELCRDGGLVRRLSAQARADMAGRDWDGAVRPLLRRLSEFRP
ncbi:glycosyltransferase [Falsirhodobacter algicola]|uniref:Glycosyltransferase n=1 Tax=Falsirhodobacter algicola TaxID=2692330 RepID=A0A8J8MTI7_9RHOB|nr:glycosyltransferase [Falsirhodobacter algicola]QUS36184.1 glycosyltransferase [Falsirhodobacter algicola]